MSNAAKNQGSDITLLEETTNGRLARFLEQRRIRKTEFLPSPIRWYYRLLDLIGDTFRLGYNPSWIWLMEQPPAKIAPLAGPLLRGVHVLLVWCLLSPCLTALGLIARAATGSRSDALTIMPVLPSLSAFLFLLLPTFLPIRSAFCASREARLGLLDDLQATPGFTWTGHFLAKTAPAIAEWAVLSFAALLVFSNQVLADWWIGISPGDVDWADAMVFTISMLFFVLGQTLLSGSLALAKGNTPLAIGVSFAVLLPVALLPASAAVFRDWLSVLRHVFHWVDWTGAAEYLSIGGLTMCVLAAGLVLRMDRHYLLRGSSTS